MTSNEIYLKFFLECEKIFEKEIKKSPIETFGEAGYISGHLTHWKRYDLIMEIMIKEIIKNKK